MNRSHIGVGIFVLGVALGVASMHWMLAGWIAPWGFGVLLPLATFLVVLPFQRVWRRGDRRWQRGGLSAWRHCSAARVVSLSSSSHDECDLDLELVPGEGHAGSPTTLRFSGVRRLTMQMSDGCMLHFDHLICDDVPAKGAHPAGLVVRDRWSEAVAFWCRSFEVLGDGELAERAGREGRSLG